MSGFLVVVHAIGCAQEVLSVRVAHTATVDTIVETVVNLEACRLKMRTVREKTWIDHTNA